MGLGQREEFKNAREAIDASMLHPPGVAGQWSRRKFHCSIAIVGRLLRLLMPLLRARGAGGGQIPCRMPAALCCQAPALRRAIVARMSDLRLRCGDETNRDHH